jgi:diaminohydroxyphosphoribosylaminopyrimidine deaminase/5-amino-6-(5-phosphoribosylamino)uracil reductase
MQRALELAELGWGSVQPNPLVGAVVLDASGRPVGEGFHAHYGGPHAEVRALAAAAHAARGGTLVVTLEPCAHYGRTPPCTTAIIEAGIERVVFGASDPNPDAAGGGRVLHAAGLEVVGPTDETAVRRQNALFFHWHEQHRPFVTLKLALSLDGRLGEPGRRTQITGPEAQAEAHRLRAGYDAIMVGAGTALVDDPLLTVRGTVQPVRPPVRIVLDSRLQLPVTSRLSTSTDLGPVILFCSENADPARRAALERCGVTVIAAANSAEGLDLDVILDTLRDLQLRSVFCEGGARLASSLARAALINRLHIFLAPHLLGLDAIGSFTGLTQPFGLPLELDRVQRFGPDVLLTYSVGRPAPAQAAVQDCGSCSPA